MSATFDKKFENWLNEQLQSIKSLTSFGNQVKEQPTVREQLQLQVTGSVIYQSINSQTTTLHQQVPQTLAAMSRTNHDVTNKHGGNYYKITYDDDDQQSLDQVTVEDDMDYDNDEKRRRERLNRILGDERLDFGSETGFEVDDEITARTSKTVTTFDENFNNFEQSNLAESRANNYSTTSLEFSDVESFVSASASDVSGAATPIRFSGDWTAATDADGVASGIGGLDGFIEFSRVRDENKSSSVDRPLTIDDDDDDPLRHRSTKPLPKNTPQRLLSSGLIAAISGRVDRSTVNGNKTSSGDRQMKEMIAVKYHKTDVPGGELPGNDFMDDDDMLIHPQQYQLPVSDIRAGSGRVVSAAGAASMKDNDHSSTPRGFLPVDLSMDIMSNDDGISAVDMEDDAAMHSEDRDPIVRTPSHRHSSAFPGSQGSRSLSQKFIWSLSNAVTLDTSRSRSCRRVLIFCSVVGGILLLVGIGVGIFLVRSKE